jgi:hypothetical protein
LSQNDCVNKWIEIYIYIYIYSWNLLMKICISMYIYIYIHLYTKKNIVQNNIKWMNEHGRFSFYIYETMFEHIFFVHLKFKNVIIFTIQIVHLTMFFSIVHFFFFFKWSNLKFKIFNILFYFTWPNQLMWFKWMNEF